jgi:hypothetical protein
MGLNKIPDGSASRRYAPLCRELEGKLGAQIVQIEVSARYY